jgi:fucose 4-O-acetylase-like acetyltransferase
MSVDTLPAGRQAWIDEMRGMAVMLVVLQHAGHYTAMYQQVPAWFTAAMLALAPFRMPVLMLLAGLFLERALRKGAGPFVIDKLRRLAWPFVLWTVVSCLAAGTPERLLQLPVWRGAGYLWFVVFLLAFFVLAVPLRRVPYLLVVAVALVISLLARDGSKHGEQLFVLMAYFFTGAFAGRHLEQCAALLRDRRALWLLPCAAAAAAASVLTGAVKFNPAWFWLVLPALAGLFALAMRVRSAFWSQVTGFVGRRSIVFYLANTPVYKASLPLLVAAGLPQPAVLAGALLLALCVPVLLALAMQRSAAVALLFEFPLALPWRRPMPALQPDG